MADINTPNYDLVKSFLRTNDFPLDKSSVWTNLDAAKAYATGESGRLSKTSYVGQVLAVIENNEVKVYKIGYNRETGKRELQELGGVIDREVKIGNTTIEPGTPIADVLEMLDEIITTEEPIDIDGEPIPSGTTINEALQLVVDKLLEKIGSAGIHADDIVPADDDIYVEQAGAGVIIGVRGISNNHVTVLDNRTVKITFSNGAVLTSEPTFLDEVTVGPFPQTTTAGNFWILSTTSYEEQPEDNQPGVVRPGNSVTITNLLEAPVGEIEITATETTL